MLVTSMNRFVFFCALASPIFAQLDLINHNRPMVDAHNCYPYEGKWADRIERALKLGFPVGIEQDLAWANGRVVVSHQKATKGDEPTLRAHFFERVRPIIEKALKENKRETWPLIVVHFDVKDDRPELLHAVWDLLGEYEGWITTAKVMADPHELAPYDVKPLLVMTEDADSQEAVFFKPLKTGAKLRLFGSAHTTAPPAGGSRQERLHWLATAAPSVLLAEEPTNYRRWWNNSWAEVEEGGQLNAGDWTSDDDLRLRALVDHAHKQGFWIRFYTLDGFVQAEGLGWDKNYNFGSREAVLKRWKAAVDAGVNLIATDQYEDLGAFLASVPARP